MNTSHRHIDGDAVAQANVQITDLFRRLFAMLCVYANRYVNDRQVAEDIVQDCFLKLLQKANAATLPEMNTSYVYTMVRNRSLNYLRDAQLTSDLTDNLESKEEEINHVIEAETLQQLSAAMSQLPPRCRKVFELYYMEGKDHEAIAGAMNVTQSTVRNQKAKGILLLRKALRLT